MDNKRIEQIAKREGKRLGLKVEKIFFDDRYKMDARMIGERGLYFFGDWTETNDNEVRAAALQQLGCYAASHKLMLRFNLVFGLVLIVLTAYFRRFVGGFFNYLLLMLFLIFLYAVITSNLEGYFATRYACEQMKKDLYYNSLDSLQEKFERDDRRPYGGPFYKIKKAFTSLGPWLARRK